MALCNITWNAVIRCYCQIFCSAVFTMTTVSVKLCYEWWYVFTWNLVVWQPSLCYKCDADDVKCRCARFAWYQDSQHRRLVWWWTAEICYSHCLHSESRRVSFVIWHRTIVYRPLKIRTDDGHSRVRELRSIGVFNIFTITFSIVVLL